MTLYLVLMLVFIVAVGIYGLRGTAPKKYANRKLSGQAGSQNFRPFLFAKSYGKKSQPPHRETTCEVSTTLQGVGRVMVRRV